MFQGFFTKKFLDDFSTTSSCFMNWSKFTFIRIILEDTHCVAWQKIICIIFVDQTETDTFIGMRLFPTMHHREVPYVSLLLSLGFLINYCIPINIFSRQLWFYHTFTHNITEGSIFISELLSLKPGVWLSQ